MTFRCAASRLFFLFLPPAAAGRARAAARARARSSSARAFRTRQYSCAGTGRVPLARRRPEATASALAGAFAW